MIKLHNFKRFLYQLLIAILISLIATHYLEYYETKFVMPIRNYIYFGRFSNSVDDLSANKIYYKFLEQPVINPVMVAKSARVEALAILEGQQAINDSDNSNIRHKILSTANVLMNMLEIEQNNSITFGRWPYEFDYPYYKIKSPWYSGMAQGHGIEVLLAAYILTGEKRYLDSAILAGKAMQIDIANGGTASKIGNSALWFEEYASANAEPPFVLNGHIFALNGLWYLKKYSPEFQNTYEAGVQALKQLLPRFDKHVWSHYDLVGTPANSKYQRIHVRLLRELAGREHNDFFIRYADKFEKQIYLPFGFTYRLIVAPGNMIVGLFVVNTISIFLILNLPRFLKRVLVGRLRE